MKCVLLNFMGRKVFTLEYAAPPQHIRVPLLKRNPPRMDSRRLLETAGQLHPHEEAQFTLVHVLASFGSPIPPNTVFYVESWAVEMGFFGL